MGVNARMVVSDEVNNGTASDPPASRHACRRSWPRSIRLRMSSATTMALSTSMPRATMVEMIETRSSSMPNWRMAIRPNSMVIGTKEPTIRPVRKPRNTMTTNSTMASVI